MPLLLIRHGQTAWNIHRRFLGRTDLPLNEEGLLQAERLGRHFAGQPWAAIYSSPLLRARQTAEALGKPVLCAELVEMDMGALEGMDREQVEAAYPGFLEAWFRDPAAMAPPQGEGLAQVQDRGLSILRQLAARHPGETVAVVAHQMLMATALCALSGTSLSRFRVHTHENTSWAVLDSPELRILSEKNMPT